VRNIRKGTLLVISAMIAITALFGGTVLAAGWSQYGEWLGIEPAGPVPLQMPEEMAGLRTEYDVIVAGTDPEGVAAAVSAARNGLTVLLVDGRNRTTLGGLMTIGWLNTIDMNRLNNKDILNEGIFTEWYRMVEGDSFDVRTAAAAFDKLVQAEPNIDVLMPVETMEPIVETAGGAKTVTGMQLKTKSGAELTIRSKAVIDATQDGDVYAAAGVPYTFGREDIGQKDAKMAVTLVFRLNDVTPEVWRGIQQSLRGKPGYGSNEMSAWGYSDMYGYKPTQTQVKMRGLNIGRQNDNTALINALLVFDVDPLNPASIEAGIKAAEAELPHVISHLRNTYPEFSTITYGGHAAELYVRESRHMIGEYRLNIIDLLENKDKWDRIAFGSYPVDLQPTKPTDNGQVLFKPVKYAVPFRSIVPKEVDGLLAVGRAASFDTLPHGSARTIPVGMAAGQAAGAAVKVALERDLTFREMSQSREAVAELQKRLNEQGMKLEPYTIQLQEYQKHPTYSGLKTVLSLGLIWGKYDNNFHYDEPANPVEFALMFANARGYFGDELPTPQTAYLPQDLALEAELRKETLSLEEAAHIAAVALGLEVQPGEALPALKATGHLRDVIIDGIKNKDVLTFGDTYMLFRDVALALGYRAPVSTVE